MPILLKELLQDIDHAKKDGMIHVEDWRMPDVEHLHNMGFDFEDDYKMSTDKPPYITVYKKEEPAKEGEDKPKEFFYIEEPSKSVKRFEKFNDVIKFFDTYSQPILDKRR